MLGGFMLADKGPPLTPVRALKIGALSVGALAVGAFALGALAIGALAIGRLVIGRSRIRHLEIEELIVGRLRVSEALETPGPPSGGSARPTEGKSASYSRDPSDLV